LPGGFNVDLNGTFAIICEYVVIEHTADNNLPTFVETVVGEVGKRIIVDPASDILELEVGQDRVGNL